MCQADPNTHMRTLRFRGSALHLQGLQPRTGAEVGDVGAVGRLVSIKATELASVPQVQTLTLRLGWGQQGFIYF